MSIKNPGDVYEDDESIADDVELYRMIASYNFNMTDHPVTIKSSAFLDTSDAYIKGSDEPAPAMSVYIESEMAKLGLTPEDLLGLPQWAEGAYGVAAITAGQARKERQGVTKWLEPDNPAHGLVFTTVTGKSRKTRGESKRLARLARTLILPAQ